jgi:hypothetical protein
MKIKIKILKTITPICWYKNCIGLEFFIDENVEIRNYGFGRVLILKPEIFNKFYSIGYDRKDALGLMVEDTNYEIILRKVKLEKISNL